MHSGSLYFTGDPCFGTFRATRRYTARCGCGKVGTYTAVRSAVSHLGQQDAETQAAALARCTAEAGLQCQYQATVTAAGPCGHQETRMAYSSVSQEAAEAAARDASAAAALQWCVDHLLVFHSTQMASYTATCPEGTTGDPYAAIRSFRATSTISQDDARDKALAAAQALAQEAAEAGITCVAITTYYASRDATAFCQPGYTGDPQTRTGTATSTVSQDDADTQATILAQQLAAAALSCTQVTYTATASATVYCPDGYTGTPSTASATATSTDSADDAYTQAYSQALTAATAALSCTGVTYTGAASYTASCPPGYTGDSVTRMASATSTISQAYADNDALAAAMSLANADLNCTPEE